MLAPRCVRDPSAPPDAAGAGFGGVLSSGSTGRLGMRTIVPVVVKAAAAETRTRLGAMQAVLWGKDHLELGEIVTRSAGPRAAVSITRGRHRKAYAYTDPN